LFANNRLIGYDFGFGCGFIHATGYFAHPYQETIRSHPNYISTKLINPQFFVHTIDMVMASLLLLSIPSTIERICYGVV
jgi:hypothetical protein